MLNKYKHFIHESVIKNVKLTKVIYYHSIKSRVKIINCKTYIWISRSCFHFLYTSMSVSLSIKQKVSKNNSIHSFKYEYIKEKDRYTCLFRVQLKIYTTWGCINSLHNLRKYKGRHCQIRGYDVYLHLEFYTF